MRYLVLLAMLGCTGGGGLYLEGERWAVGDGLFHQDPHWLGGDTAASVDLGDDRTLWLFGDSFIATSPARTRAESAIVHNSVAVMSGHDLATATMEHAWRRDPVPGDYFPPATEGWLSPMSGVRVPGGLVIFAAVVGYAPGGTGTFVRGTQPLVVADPSGPAAAWTVESRPFSPPSFQPDALIGCTAVDGDHLVGLAIAGRGARLVRWPLDRVVSDLDAREWWSGRAWVTEPELTTPPPIAIDGIGPSCSLLPRDPALAYEGLGPWVLVSGDDGSVDYRLADAIEGPYFGGGAVFEPSDEAHAGRGHALIVDDLGSHAATYVDTGTPEELLDPAREYRLYWPHMIRLAHYEAVE